MTDNVRWHQGEVPRSVRTGVTNGEGCTVWLTGLSGSGKSTIAHRCEVAVVEAGRLAYTLDGDNIRHGLNTDLGFSATDRAENVRRVGEVARLMADAGIVVFAPLISPYTDGRLAVKYQHCNADIAFYEVHIATPLEVCEERDTKGFYAMARAGEIADFTGISAPYEAPEHPDLTIDTTTVDLDTAVTQILALIGIR
ncbi:MAG: adenylyl-sulfate kinase [Actinomycetia bacterium]|nr:adenylyl-sulfate kinase [Actinomycetes bacterium]